MCPSAYRVFNPPGAGGVENKGYTGTKTFLEHVGMCEQNFIKISVGVWISITPPRTNRQTNKNYAHFCIYRRLINYFKFQTFFTTKTFRCTAKKCFYIC